MLLKNNFKLQLFIISLVILTLNVSIASSFYKITPDPNNPIVIKPLIRPYFINSDGFEISLNFSISNSYFGIVKENIIAVKFQQITNMSFMTSSYSCGLSSINDSNITKNYSTTSLKPLNNSDINTAYCMINSILSDNIKENSSSLNNLNSQNNLIDNFSNNLELINGNIKFTLKINITSEVIPYYIKYVNLFITTNSSSNLNQRIILAQTILYNNNLSNYYYNSNTYDNNSNTDNLTGSDIMEIYDIKVENKSNYSYCPSPCYNLYPNSLIEIDLKLQFNSNIKFLGEESGRLLIELSNDLDASGVIGISSSSYYTSDVNNLTKALESTESGLNLSVVSEISNNNINSNISNNNNNNKLIFEVLNINEDITMGRKFSIKITGLKTKNKINSSDILSNSYNINNNIKRNIYRNLYNDYINYSTNTKNIIFSIVYKNSYSKLAQIYNSKFDNLFDIKTYEITFNSDINSSPPSDWYGISHPDFFENIYENAAWPLKFVFNVPRLPEGGYMVIDHKTVENDNTKIFNFITSTCEFSDSINNGYIDNTIGLRPNCYPLYDTLNIGTNTPKSGLYFKLPAFNDTDYKTIAVTIWGIAVKCSDNEYEKVIEGSYTVDMMSDTERNRNKKKYAFDYYIYSKLNSQSNDIISNLNSNYSNTISYNTKFEYLFNNFNLIARKQDVSMYGYCNGNMIAHKTSAFFNKDIKSFYKDSNLISNTKDVVLFKEFHNFNISSRSSTNNPFAFEDSSKFKYIYDINNNNNSDLEFGVIDFNNIYNNNTNDNIDNIIQSIEDIPLPIYISGTEGSYNINRLKETLTIQLSNKYITKKPVDTGNCYLKWFTSSQNNVSSDFNNNNITGNNFISTSALDSTQQINPTKSNLNSVANEIFTSIDYTALSFIAPIKIVSNYLDTNSGNSSKSSFPDSLSYSELLSTTKLGFSTDCYNFVVQSNINNIKSIYDNYIDFTYYFTRIVDDSITPVNEFINRVGRFINLGPMIGVFNNPLLSNINLAFDNNLSTTTIDNIKNKLYYAFSDNDSDMCILRIDYSYFNNIQNTLLLTLINIKLLDVDSTELNTTYPAAPILTSLFSLNSVYPFNYNNSYNQGGLLNSRQNYSNYSIIANVFSNTSNFNNNNNNNYLNSHYSYYTYFGSSLIINPITNSIVTLNIQNANDPQQDLFVPVFCPVGSNKVGNKDHYSFVVPSLHVMSFESINNKFDDIDINYGFKNFNISFNDVDKSNTKFNGYSSLLIKKGVIEKTTSNLHNKIDVNFAQLSSDSLNSNSRLYLKSHQENVINTDCNSIALLISKEIDLDSSISNINYISNSITGVYNINNVLQSKTFYYKNKPFNKFLIYNIQEEDPRIQISKNNLVENYISGVIRPKINDYLNKRIYNIENKYGFQCIKHNEEGNGSIFSNYNYEKYDLTNDNNYETNNYNDRNNEIKNNFSCNFRDLSSDSNSSGWNISVNKEYPELDIYSNDPAFKIKFNITINTKIPYVDSSNTIIKNILSIKSNIFNPYSTCALKVTNKSYSSMCYNLDSLNNPNTLECNLNVLGDLSSNISNTFLICCHNVKFLSENVIIYNDSNLFYYVNNNNLINDNSNNTDYNSININTKNYFNYYFNNALYSNSILNKHYLISKLNSSNTNVDTGYNPALSDSITDINTLVPEITSIKFSQTNQENSLGVLYLNLDLKRHAVPYQRIRIKSSLSVLFISNFSPSCDITYNNNLSSASLDSIEFGSNYYNGDYLIDKCLYNENDDTIDIYNKNYSVLSCENNDIASNLIIKIYPVYQKDISLLTTDNKHKYKVYSSIIDFTTSNYLIAKAPDSDVNNHLSFPEANFPANQFNVVSSSVELCNLIGIYSNIISLKNQVLIFKLDLSDLPILSDNKHINEVSLFFNRNNNLFFSKDSEPNNPLKCSFNNNDDENTTCYWTKDGFINIYYNTVDGTYPTLINEGVSYLLVTIYSGIIIPDLVQRTENDSTNIKDILCSLNYKSDTSRENILTGNGRIIYGSKYDNSSIFDNIISKTNNSNDTNYLDKSYTSISISETTNPYTLTIFKSFDNINLSDTTMFVLVYNSNDLDNHSQTMKDNFDNAIQNYKTLNSDTLYLNLNSMSIDISVDILNNLTNNSEYNNYPYIIGILPNKLLSIYQPYDSINLVYNYSQSDIEQYIQNTFNSYFYIDTNQTLNKLNYKVIWDSAETYISSEQSSNNNLEYTDPYLMQTQINIDLNNNNSKLSIVYLGNSQIDYDIFILLASKYQAFFNFYHCLNEDCLKYFKVSNGDLLLFYLELANTVKKYYRSTYYSFQIIEYEITKLLIPSNISFNEFGIDLISTIKTPYLIIVLNNDDQQLIDNISTNINVIIYINYNLLFTLSLK